MSGQPGNAPERPDLEANPQKYMGQRISVDGEVEEIYGPTLFTIDEPHWGDLDGEILVHVPTPLAALVKDNDRVTISGTVKPFVRAELEREWGWLGFDADGAMLGSGDHGLVGRRISLDNVRVAGNASRSGFFIDVGIATYSCSWQNPIQTWRMATGSRSTAWC